MEPLVDFYHTPIFHLVKFFFVTFSLVDLLLGRGSAPLQEAGRPQLVRGKHGLEHSTCKELCPVNENRVSKLCTKMEKKLKIADI